MELQKQITIEELAERIAALPEGGKFDFYIEEDCWNYGVARQQLFGGDIIIINLYGGGNPCIIDFTEATDRVEKVLHVLKRYILPSEVGEIYVEVEDAQPLDKSQLYTMKELLAILEKNGSDGLALVAVGDHYMETVGEYPIWRYPLNDGGYEGGSIVPVQEGWLYLPCEEIDREDYDQFALKEATLLDAETCKRFAQELESYCRALVAVFGRIQNELKTQEENEND